MPVCSADIQNGWKIFRYSQYLFKEVMNKVEMPSNDNILALCSSTCVQVGCHCCMIAT